MPFGAALSGAPAISADIAQSRGNMDWGARDELAHVRLRPELLCGCCSSHGGGCDGCG